MRRRGDGLPRELLQDAEGEEVYPHDYRTFEEAEANLSQFIEDVDKEPKCASTTYALDSATVSASSQRTSPQWSAVKCAASCTSVFSSRISIR